MEVIKLTVGQLQSNAYILKKNHQVIIIDPGADFNRIDAHIKETDNVLAVILTHGHFDHIGAVNEVFNKYHCNVYVSLAEKELINNPSMSFYDDKINCDLVYFEDDFMINDFTIKVHHTPGHTKGSVMFEIEGHLFTGDTIFDMAVGRMDLPTGSEIDMQNSLNYIKTLKHDFPIYPGHGGNSTLFIQFQRNPYFN